MLTIVQILERELTRVTAKAEGADQRRRESELMADMYRGEAEVIRKRIAELRKQSGDQVEPTSLPRKRGGNRKPRRW